MAASCQTCAATRCCYDHCCSHDGDCSCGDCVACGGSEPVAFTGAELAAKGEAKANADSAAAAAEAARRREALARAEAAAAASVAARDAAAAQAVRDEIAASEREFRASRQAAAVQEEKLVRTALGALRESRDSLRSTIEAFERNSALLRESEERAAVALSDISAKQRVIGELVDVTTALVSAALSGASRQQPPLERVCEGAAASGGEGKADEWEDAEQVAVASAVADSLALAPHGALADDGAAAAGGAASAGASLHAASGAGEEDGGGKQGDVEASGPAGLGGARAMEPVDSRVSGGSGGGALESKRGWGR